jgi:hypothetical protein
MHDPRFLKRFLTLDEMPSLRLSWVYNCANKETADSRVLVLHDDFPAWEDAGCFLFFDFDRDSTELLFGRV